MIKYSLTMVSALLLAAVMSGPAVAVENPVVVDLHATASSAREASATIFGSGSSVLVNVTAEHGVPKDAAVTLNDGTCAHPGDIAFALSGFADNGSLTKLDHSLVDIAGKAKSLVIHQTASETSPAFACGKVSG